MKTPELLLPVGTMDMCLAAIHNGADAVYIGMPGFNARGRSQDFSFEELKEMIDLCHLYGVKVHLAFNILIFEKELVEAQNLLSKVIPLGVDAFIVQDLGLARLIKSMAPSQVVHGSTQMTVSNHEAINFLSDLKLERFVLAREVSIPEMKLIRENTEKELEVFVHGALCVSYSGQCLTSESIGGRSANRGQCAQSCRLDYELYVDGEKKNLGDKRYLVSPQDLCGVEQVEELKSIGIDSFKVEGRLKTAEYVAAAAKNYKQAITDYKFDKIKAKEEMGLTYSRGFFTGWLKGVDHQKLVNAKVSSHVGNHLGKISSIKKNTVEIVGQFALKAGDGLVFKDYLHKNDIGGKIYEVKVQANTTLVSLGREFNYENLKKGMDVFHNSSESLKKELISKQENREKKKRLPIKIHLKLKMNQPLIATASDGKNEVLIKSETSLTAAVKQALSRELLQDEFMSLGQTCYTLNEFTIEMNEPLFLQQKEIKKVRQQLVHALNLARTEVVHHSLNHIEIKTKLKENPKNQSELVVLVRNTAQLEAALMTEVKHIILDYDYGKEYKVSVEKIKAKGKISSIATTRILKPNEYKNLNVILKAMPDRILVRNLGAANFLIKMAPEIPLDGDYSLNVANHFSADYLFSKGLKMLTPSYDLNSEQLSDLLASCDADSMPVVLHQYIPEFHMEHCVFAGFLSEGSSFRDCGMPCEKHQVVLKDAYNNFHPLKADQECRNTMFRGTPQTCIPLVSKLKNLGVKEFRLEALNETQTELVNKINLYLDFLAERINEEEILLKLKITEAYGLFTGQMQMRDNYQDRKRS